MRSVDLQEVVLQRKLLPKLKDLGRFIIPYSIGTDFSSKALCDLGVSIPNATIHLQEVGFRRSEANNNEAATR